MHTHRSLKFNTQQPKFLLIQGHILTTGELSNITSAGIVKHLILAQTKGSTFKEVKIAQ